MELWRQTALLASIISPKAKPKVAEAQTESTEKLTNPVLTTNRNALC
jgi:hypothetical protein